MTWPTAIRTGPTEIRWWHDRWIDLASPRIEGSIALLRALRAKGVPVFALTNFGIHTFAYARDAARFPDRVRPRLHLGPTGRHQSPTARSMRIVEEDCGTAARARLLFTDDRRRQHRRRRRRAAGRRIMFDGPEGWARRLVAAGLLTKTEAGL